MEPEAEHNLNEDDILGVDELHIKDSASDENQDEAERFDFDDVTLDITPDKSGGVLKKILKEGEGEECPGFGDRVSVHYTGWLLGKDPVEFDSSRKDQKFEFNLGRGLVIKGWDLGIGTMKKGEVSLFICHPRYAYGEMGYPPTIPPHAPLLFEVELFEWKLDDLSPKRDDSILRKVLEKGEGNSFPNEGSLVKVEIIQYTDGNKTREEKEFILGEGCIADIPEGLEIALLKFAPQEKSILFLRKKYAEEVLKESNTTDAELKYEITLLHFEKAKNIWEMNSDEKLEKAKVSKEKGIQYYKMGLYRVALKQFKWIVTCLENEPGADPDTRETREALLLSGYLNIALCQQKLENHADVAKACSKALAIDPSNEKALFRRGQAKFEMNDCEEAVCDFEKLCSLNPDNKAAKNSILLCQNKMKMHQLKDKSTYNKMFEFFVKQDEERTKSTKTESGVWSNDDRSAGEATDEARRVPLHSEFSDNNSALLDANVIELSNTGILSFQV